ncbi:ABC transporter permease [Acetobacterium bakii]|uniref:ABC transporter permease n=1 Tax=Acetobacterium bakii TaxID=52689 RepID=A0A0L6U4F2_9FIRM|nr:ABC transporter permease [Acetobacterium bakii]KNZ43386.1 ABC transporter permease [Acetobacterium bakii]
MQNIKAIFLKPYSKYVWIGIMLIAWEAIAKLTPVSPLAFPSLEAVVAALINSILTGDILLQMLFSLGLIFVGLVIGVLLSFVMSALSVVSPVFESFVDTCVSIFHPLPGIALLPLIILWIGTGSKAILFIIVHSVLWPMILNMTAGFKSIPVVYKKIGQNYEFSNAKIIFKIYIPASMPYLIAGLKIGWARAWRASISAEMIFGASGGIGGIGWYIFNKRVFMDTAGIFAGLLVIIVVGMLVEDFIFSKIEDRTVKKWGLS